MTNIQESNSKVLKEMAKYWSEKIGVCPEYVQVKPMKRKWASCSNGGRITLSKDLLNESSTFCEYVIIHELIHLKVPNHGKLFKSLLKSIW